ncbi:MAG: glycosyl transferase [Deltaproteobacteria bacterium]|nr:glycosyl transferase [Deltaproteobacteria bacterium]
MDEPSHEVLQRIRLPHVRLITLAELEKQDVDLLNAKGNRSPVEYYFTCTPSLPLHILKNHAEVDLVTYLDADLFFFSNPESLFHELAARSIGIIPHRFPEALKNLEQFGKFNVGWVSFRRDAQGIACLEWWREKCLEWCYDRIEEGRFADQKYLDLWPDLFKEGLAILHHKGANLAPWNLANYHITRRKNSVYVDELQLLFYHFHGLRSVKTWIYDPQIELYGTKSSILILRHIYAPYVRMLKQQAKMASPLHNRPVSLHNIRTRHAMTSEQGSLPPHLKLGYKFTEYLRILKRILLRKYFCLIRDRVL